MLHTKFKKKKSSARKPHIPSKIKITNSRARPFKIVGHP